MRDRNRNRRKRMGEFRPRTGTRTMLMLIHSGDLAAQPIDWSVAWLDARVCFVAFYTRQLGFSTPGLTLPLWLSAKKTGGRWWRERKRVRERRRGCTVGAKREKEGGDISQFIRSRSKNSPIWVMNPRS